MLLSRVRPILHHQTECEPPCAHCTCLHTALALFNLRKLCISSSCLGFSREIFIKKNIVLLLRHRPPPPTSMVATALPMVPSNVEPRQVVASCRAFVREQCTTERWRKNFVDTTTSCVICGTCGQVTGRRSAHARKKVHEIVIKYFSLTWRRDGGGGGDVSSGRFKLEF